MEENNINKEEKIRKENKVITDTLNRLIKEAKEKKEQETQNNNQQ